MSRDAAPPLVSVVLPVKNGERYLESSIRSVVQSDYRPLEVIVVDYHSTDNTANIAKSFQLVRYVTHEQSGISAAWNQGIELAGGSLVAFTSHDDIWMPNKLALQVSHLLDHPEVQYVVCKAKFFLDDGSAIPSGFRTSLLEQPRVAHIMETLLARKSLFDKVGKLDTTLATAHDVDWFSRVRDFGISGAAIQETLVHKRIHDSNSHMAVSNTRELLKAMKRSVDRKQRSQSEE